MPRRTVVVMRWTRRRRGFVLAAAVIGLSAVVAGGAPVAGQAAAAPSIVSTALELVSLDDNGEQPFYVRRDSTAISPNGRYVAFTTGGRGVHGVPTNESVAVRDRQGATTISHDSTVVGRRMQIAAVDDRGNVVVTTSVDLTLDGAPRSATGEHHYLVALDGSATRVTELNAAEAVTPALADDGTVLVVGDLDGDGSSPELGAWTAAGLVRVDGACGTRSCTAIGADAAGEVYSAVASVEGAGVVADLQVVNRIVAGSSDGPTVGVAVGVAGGSEAPLLSWDGRIVAWIPNPGDRAYVQDLTSGRSVSIELGDTPTQLLDFTNDGQLLLIERGDDPSSSVGELVDLGTLDRITVGPANLAQGVGLDAFGTALLWGDQANINSRLFVESIERACDVATGWRSGDDELMVCADGNARGIFDGIAVGSPSWITDTTTAGVLVSPPTDDAPGAFHVVTSGGELTDSLDRTLPDAAGPNLAAPIVDAIGDATGFDYWLIGSDGGVFAVPQGSGYFGSAGDIALREPIVAGMVTPSRQGYWLVASDGGVFSFGDAGFFGSTGAIDLVSPIVAGVPTPSGQGYWLVASDGGVFAFGDAPFLGSGVGRLVQGETVVDGGPLGPGHWLLTNTGRWIDLAA